MEIKEKIDLARKILALASRGDNGEREVAERKLHEFLYRHGLTMSDIEDVETDRRIKVSQQHKIVLGQLILKLIGRKAEVSDVVYTRTKRYAGEIAFNATDSEFAEVCAAWTDYETAIKREYAAMRKEHKARLAALPTAFIYKNDLFAPADGAPRRKPSAKEMEELRRALRMAEDMEEVSYIKKIS